MGRKFKKDDEVKLKRGTLKMYVVEYYVDYTGSVMAAIAGSSEGINSTSRETTIVVVEWYDDKNNREERQYEEDLLEFYNQA